MAKIHIGDGPAIVKPKPATYPIYASEKIAHEIHNFLNFEARLLDNEGYQEWLDLLTPDIHYWMPGIQALYRSNAGVSSNTETMAFYDDDMLSLRRRVTRFVHQTAWAEDPPTRCVRVISGIEVLSTDIPDEVIVHSTFTNCRGRNELDEDILYGRRQDLLRKTDGGWKIAKRRITITQAVLKAKNLNIFL